MNLLEERCLEIEALLILLLRLDLERLILEVYLELFALRSALEVLKLFFLPRF